MIEMVGHNDNRQKTLESLKKYEIMHREKGFKVDDGSYDIFAAFSRGNKTVDIACGEGWIEKLNPEVIGVDFSENALHNAKKNGAKFVVCALAEHLPFKDNAFDVSICAGSLEHFIDPQLALDEISRVSKIQVFTVHAKLPFLLEILRKIVTKLFKIGGQPIENPFRWKEVLRMCERAGLSIIFWGYWRYLDLSFISKRLPYGLVKIPSHFFLVSIRKDRSF